MPTLALLTLLVMMTGCGLPPTAKSIPVRLAMTRGSVGHLPAELADSLGFYRAEGLDVTIIRTSGSSKVMETLLGGAADVACAGHTQSIQLAVEGRAVPCFVAEFNNHGYSLVVSPAAAVGKRISKIEDLRGATVGVTALGSGTHQFLTYLLGKHGVTPAQVSTVPSARAPPTWRLSSEATSARRSPT